MSKTQGPLESKPFGLVRRPKCWLSGHKWTPAKRFDPFAKRVEPSWFCERCGKDKWRPSGEMM